MIISVIYDIIFKTKDMLRNKLAGLEREVNNFLKTHPKELAIALTGFTLILTLIRLGPEIAIASGIPIGLLGLSLYLPDRKKQN